MLATALLVVSVIIPNSAAVREVLGTKSLVLIVLKGRL